MPCRPVSGACLKRGQDLADPNPQLATHRQAPLPMLGVQRGTVDRGVGAICVAFGHTGVMQSHDLPLVVEHRRTQQPGGGVGVGSARTGRERRPACSRAAQAGWVRPLGCCTMFISSPTLALSSCSHQPQGIRPGFSGCPCALGVVNGDHTEMQHRVRDKQLARQQPKRHGHQRGAPSIPAW